MSRRSDEGAPLRGWRSPLTRFAAASPTKRAALPRFVANENVDALLHADQRGKQKTLREANGRQPTSVVHV
jgi:hypothetical protein